VIRSAARLVNPLVLRIAGRRHMPVVGIVRHRGRKTAALTPHRQASARLECTLGGRWFAAVHLSRHNLDLYCIFTVHRSP
jgi:hypothetical protein